MSSSEWFISQDHTREGRKRIRKAGADERAKDRASLTDKEQLQKLLDRGITKGREVDRLCRRSNLVIFDRVVK